MKIMHPCVGSLLLHLKFQAATAKMKEIFHTGRHWPIIAMLMLGCALLSVIIPPFRSPDEANHIKRAYLLGKGVIVLAQQEGRSSGGYIDSSLARFMRQSSTRVQEKLSAEELDARSVIHWSGNLVFSSLPGMGYYFPIIYFPQALALMVGERLNLSINHSYRLARAFALGAIALLLYAAFRVYPPNPLVLALLAMPMTLFQMSAASLDGIATALAIFSIAAFLRITEDRQQCSPWIQYALPLAVALLVSSRVHALPMLVLMPTAFFYTKNKRVMLASAALGLGVFLWLLIATKTVVDLRVPSHLRAESTANIIAFYLLNPGEFFRLVWETCDHDQLAFFWMSFVGVLDYLHTYLIGWRYTQFAGALCLITLLTLSFANIKSEWPHRLLLLSVSVISVLFIFFALLVTWSPHPTQRIMGIQGRYFLIPAIIFAYALAGNAGWAGGVRRSVATAASLLFFIFSLLTTADTLVDRYYLSDNKPRSETIIAGSAAASGQQRLVSGAVLKPGATVALKFPALDEDEVDKTTRVCIVLDTYSRSHLGEAEMLLTAKEGAVSRHTFSLRSLVDYDYKCFTVPEAHYVSGQLRAISGGGVSVVELHDGAGDSVTCMKFNNRRGQTVAIKGCP